MVAGQVFNVVYQNFRISELAIRVRKALRELGYEVDVNPDYGYKGVRSYRIAGDRAERVLGVKPVVAVEESVRHIVEQLHEHHFTDWDNPRYYNIRWMKLLEEAEDIIGVTGSVFGMGSAAGGTKAERRGQGLRLG
jgi:signal recognition particle subunit SEC65